MYGQSARWQHRPRGWRFYDECASFCRLGHSCRLFMIPCIISVVIILLLKARNILSESKKLFPADHSGQSLPWLCDL